MSRSTGRQSQRSPQKKRNLWTDIQIRGIFENQAAVSTGFTRDGSEQSSIPCTSMLAVAGESRAADTSYLIASRIRSMRGTCPRQARPGLAAWNSGTHQAGVAISCGHNKGLSGHYRSKQQRRAEFAGVVGASAVSTCPAGHYPIRRNWYIRSNELVRSSHSDETGQLLGCRQQANLAEG